MTRPREVSIVGWIALAGAAWTIVRSLLFVTGIFQMTPPPGSGLEELQQAGIQGLVGGLGIAALWAVIGWGVLAMKPWVRLLALTAALFQLAGQVMILTEDSVPGGALAMLAAALWAVALLVMVALLFTSPLRHDVDAAERRPRGVSVLAFLYYLKVVALLSITTMFLGSVVAPAELGPPGGLAGLALFAVAAVCVALAAAGGVGLSTRRPWGRSYVVAVHWTGIALGCLGIVIGLARGGGDAGDSGAAIGQMLPPLLYLGGILVYLYRPKVREAFERMSTETAS